MVQYFRSGSLIFSGREGEGPALRVGAEAVAGAFRRQVVRQGTGNVEAVGSKIGRPNGPFSLALSILLMVLSFCH